MKRNSGFSLVELIIVIAIMAVLIGLLAPQYLRFVNRSKVVTDADNATNMAYAIEAAIADSPDGTVPTSISGRGGTTVENVTGLTVLPDCKVNKNYEWNITIGSDGVSKITLNGDVIYPGNLESLEYYTAHYH